MYRKKTAVITGASRGIGRSIAIRFAENGYDLALCCHNQTEKLNQLSDELTEKYQCRCLTYTGDIGQYQIASDFFQLIYKEYHHIDVLINNAGISMVGLITDMTPQDWNHILSTNLNSVFNCCHLAIPSMIHSKSGRIINISSVWGCCGASCEVAYSTTKGGVNAFTQALAKELAPSNIQVNAIACGAIETEMNAFLSPEDKQTLFDEIPTGRFGHSDEVADFALQLSQSPAYLTGQIIRLDGGWI